MKYNTLITLLLISFCVCGQFEDALDQLGLLEYYAEQFKKEKGDSRTVNFLTLAYIRSAKYTGTEWEIAAGSVPTDFIEYIKQIDEKEQTNIQQLRKYGDVLVPSGNKTDFVHMFAVMNGCDYAGNFDSQSSQLVGWAGDTAQLFQDIMKKTGTFDELYKMCRDLLGHAGGFGEGDLIGDLDAVNLLKLKYDNPSKTFAYLYKAFYIKDFKKRVPNFIQNSFPGLIEKTQTDYRNKLYDLYTDNFLIRVWECKHNLRDSGFLGCVLPGSVKKGLENHQKAAVYAFADFLYENREGQ